VKHVRKQQINKTYFHASSSNSTIMAFAKVGNGSSWTTANSSRKLQIRSCHYGLFHEMGGSKRGHRDSSPSTEPNVVLKLRLDSVFVADTCHLCRQLLGSEGTAAPTGAGPAHLRAAAVCSRGAGTFSRPYFQLMHIIIVCL
jgi:hypothetical protein